MDMAASFLTARETLFHFFRSLPVSMFSSVLLLGAFQGNINYILFAIGIGVLAPLFAIVANMGFEFVFNYIDKQLNLDSSYWSIANGASCTLFETVSKNPFTSMNAVPTTWSVMTSFFFVYLLINSVTIYNLPTPAWADQTGVNARKTRTLMSSITISIIAVIVFLIRYSLSSCETITGLIIGILLGSYLAYSWYNIMFNCGLGRFDDVFGISNRLLSREASEKIPPKVCVPV